MSGQGLNPCEEIVTDSQNRVHADFCGHLVGADIEEPGTHGKQEHHNAPQRDELVALLRDDFIDDVGKNPGKSQIHKGSQDLDHKAPNHPSGIWFKISGDGFH